MKKNLFFIFCLLPLSAFGWWDLAHMAIAKIAYDRLAPSVKQHVDCLVALSECPESNTFITAACWADDISQETNLFRSVHACSIPYDPDNILSAHEVEIETISAECRTLVPAIEACEQTLKNPNARPFAKSLALRLLIHLIGDLHQPLHCLSLYNANFPKGDLGGNFFSIKNAHCSNLHAYWDSMCGLCVQRPGRPLSYEAEQVVIALADQCLPYLACEKCYISGSLQEWVEQSRACAVMAYEGSYERQVSKIYPGDTISHEYELMGQQICQRQIALAGARLAYLLNQCLAKIN